MKYRSETCSHHHRACFIVLHFLTLCISVGGSIDDTTCHTTPSAYLLFVHSSFTYTILVSCVSSVGGDDGIRVIAITILIPQNIFHSTIDSIDVVVSLCTQRTHTTHSLSLSVCLSPNRKLTHQPSPTFHICKICSSARSRISILSSSPFAFVLSVCSSVS